MVPRRQQEMSDRASNASSEPEDDEVHSISSASEAIDEEMDVGAGVEPEYHTEESDLEEEDDSEHETLHNTAPLLPKELLKPLPSPAYSLQQPINIPREQMTRQQKATQRSSNRKAKKRMWDKLRKDTQGTGVLETGKVAQLKRFIVTQRDKVKRGRVTKKTHAKPPVSGRHQLLEQRKRAVEQSNRELLRPRGKGRRRRRKQASTG